MGMKHPRIVQRVNANMDQRSLLCHVCIIHDNAMERPQCTAIPIFEHSALDRGDAPYGVALRRPLHKLANASRTSSCNLWIDLIGIRCSGRTRACAIAKNMESGKADLLDNLERGIEFLIGFARKSHDQITRKGDFGNVTANLSNESKQVFGRIGSAHTTKRLGATGLNGQMQKRGYTIGRLPHTLKQGFGNVHRLDGRKANLLHRGLTQNAIEQLVDLDVHISRTLRVVSAKIHTRKNHLGDIGLDRIVNLFQNSRNGNRTLGTARFPDNAICASVVASVLDLDAPTRTTKHIGKIAGSRSLRSAGQKTCIIRKELTRAIDNSNLGRLCGDTRRDVGKDIRMQVNHATRDDNKRLIRK